MVIAKQRQEYLPISVIIPVQNGEKFLSDAISSVLVGQRADAEIIVVDDGSDDATPSIIQHYLPAIRCVRFEKPVGACAARNKGLALARGEFVKFLDADDTLEPGSLAAQLDAYGRSSSNLRSCLYGDALWVDERGVELPSPRSQIPEGQSEEEHIAWVISNAPLTSCPLHRRATLVEVGGFDPRVRRGQEHDLHVRLALTGVRFSRLPGIAYRYRQHSGPRISSIAAEVQAQSWFDMAERHLASAKAKFGGVVPEVIKVSVARLLWRQGRQLLQVGCSERATNFFVRARMLGGEQAIFGGAMYKLGVRLLGPQLSEAWSMSRRQR